MGYQRPILRLIFDESTGDMAGLEVLCRRMSVGHVKDIQALAQTTGDMKDPDNLARLDRCLNVLAEHLVGWNLEDDNGAPVPADVDTLKQQDLPFLMGIFEQWMKQAIGVRPPLLKPSEDGEPFPEGSIPMTDLPSFSLLS